MSKVYHFRREQRIAAPRDEVFSFFETPHNLEAITPAFLKFQTLTPPPIRMAAGTLIDYQLRLYGVPIRWRTRIDVFDPPHRFVDVQLRGPYRRWHHEHEFIADGEDTRMIDRVEYELRLGPIGSLANAMFVRRSLEQIFDYRRDGVEQMFPVKPDPY
jgi:ligand-binding SRPBCC domain-containing protein